MFQQRISGSTILPESLAGSLSLRMMRKPMTLFQNSPGRVISSSVSCTSHAAEREGSRNVRARQDSSAAA